MSRFPSPTLADRIDDKSRNSGIVLFVSVKRSPHSRFERVATPWRLLVNSTASAMNPNESATKN
jgi:hypothetical protein